MYREYMFRLKNLTLNFINQYIYTKVKCIFVNIFNFLHNHRLEVVVGNGSLWSPIENMRV